MTRREALRVQPGDELSFNADPKIHTVERIIYKDKDPKVRCPLFKLSGNDNLITYLLIRRPNVTTTT